MPVADATIDADFHVTAMVATAPGEKTPHRAPPCEELDPPYDVKLAFVQKINKNCCHQSCLFGLQYAPNRLSAEASPQTPLVELTALLQTP